MRIQHNIMAMNAYNQYNKNTKALSANLEKLSSGYRINRAGDDAAGLAISEKMRAQITGLDAAQNNVKDGISLVKTAEGAMQEIHDMLNKMTSLATQSANGTYQDEVDRENLQKEIESIKSEINRIADSANFNGIKLLDGSLDANAKGAVIGAGKDRMIQTELAAADNPIDEVGKKTMYDGASSEPSKTKFTVDFSGMTASAAADAGKPAVYSIQITNAATTAAVGDIINIAGQTITIDTAANGGDIELADAGDATKLATVIANKLNGNFETDYTITADGDKLVFTAKNNGTIGGSGPTAAVAAAPTITNARGLAFGTVTTEDAGAEPAAAAAPSVDFTIGDLTVTGVTLADKDDATKIATAVYGQIAGGTATIDGQNFTVTDNNDGTLTFELDTEDDIQGNYDWDLAVTAGAIDGAHTAGTSVVIPGSSGAAGSVANTVFEIKSADLKDGTTITLDGKTVKLAVGANSTVTDADVTLTDADVADINLALSKISAAFGGGTTNFIVGMNDTSNLDVQAGLTVHKKADSKNTYDTKEKLGAVFSINEPGSGKALTLQIGEDSEEYNQMKVSVGDMHTTAMGIDSIDIGTQAGAQEAVAVIKDAINYVSSIRGDLGAIQNRLDHTGNNLAVMEENIQDAESTIRDTDVAEEMMAYVKNNILVQSAQAMLAQANQVPQGVLQLLG